MTSKLQDMQWRRLRPPGKFVSLAVACLALTSAFHVVATNAPPRLNIALSGQTPELSWDAQPGAFYTILSRSNLAPGSSWVEVEPVTTSSNLARWKAPELNANSDRVLFYQLRAPEPAIFRIEPTVVSTAGGTVYLVGQCLGTGGVARVAGLVLAPNVLQPGSIYTFRVPALPEGTYDVEWMENGQVTATGEKLFSVTAEVQPVGIAQRLFEMPEPPPAEPSGFREVTGLDVYIDTLEIQEGGVNTGAHKRPGPTSFAQEMNKTKERGTYTKCSSDLRVMPPTGEVQVEEVDFAIEGRGLDFVWARRFRSRTGQLTPMGRNWTHSYHIFIQQDGTGIAVNDGTGRRDVYFPGTNGVYTRDEFFNEGTFSNGTFMLTFPDGGKWEFRAIDGSPSSGKISRIVDRNGNALSLYHNIDGQLLAIIDALGRSNSIAYTAAGFVSSVTDFSGRVTRYEYDTAGNLAASISPAVVGTVNGNDFPGGKTNRYAYSSGFSDERLNYNLTSITDPKGQTSLRVVYGSNPDPASPAFDAVDYVQRGPYRTKFRRFPQTPSPANGFAVVKCIENDGVGNVTEYFCDSQNRCVRQLQYTGRANPDLATTETQNRPVNKLRATDPDFYETRFEWNPDSLCTLITEPGGNTTEMVYQRAFNQNSSRSNNARAHAGDLRVLRERAPCCGGLDDDGDGLADITERAWRFEYDPRFGSPCLARLNVTKRNAITATQQNRVAALAKDGPIEPAKGFWRPKGQMFGKVPGSPGPQLDPGVARIKWSSSNPSDGYTTKMIDPRGNVTTATYDPNGNLVSHAGPRIIPGDQGPIINDFVYNPFGQLRAHVHPADGEGRRRRDERVYYDSGPQLGYVRQTIADCVAAGFHLTNTFEYDARGNVTRHINPRGFDSLATYNALDQMVTRQTPNTSFGSLVRYTTAFTYDANDNLIRREIDNLDENGVPGPNATWRTQFQYDALNRMTSCWRDKNGALVLRCKEVQYDANDNVTLYRSGEAVNGSDPHNVVQYLYDERDLAFRTIHGPGSPQPYTEQYSYTRNGWKHHDIRGLDSPTLEFARTVYEYDGFDRPIRTIDAMGNVVRRAFDANDNLVFQRFEGETNDVPEGVANRRLSEIRWTHDALDRCIQTTTFFFDISTQSPIGDGASVSACVYAPNGQVLSETDDNGHMTRYTYDSLGRLSSVIDPAANTVACVYDECGNVLSITERDRSGVTPGTEQTFVSTFGYDGLNRVIRYSDQVSNETTCRYDSRGNVVSVVDARGNETVFDYDGLSRCVETTSYEGTARGITINTTHVEYSDNDRRTACVDANGNSTHYTYDSLDRLVLTTHADGTTESLVWSPRSNLASRTDPNGTVVTCTHDLLDRCVRKDISPAAGVDSTTTFELFTYDGLSRLMLGTNDASMVEYSYDSLGNREKAKADCIAAAAIFDGEGNRLSLTYPGGRVVQYTYDELDRVATVGSSVPGGPFVTHATFAYDGPDRLGRISRPGNGVNTRIQWNGLQNPPNTAGDFGFQQVAGIRHQRVSDGSLIAQRTFTYDRAQNKASSVAAPFVPGGSVVSAALHYDPLDRLTNLTRTVNGAIAAETGYVLDSLGSRSRVTRLGGATDLYSMDSQLPEPADAQMNQSSFTPLGNEFYDRNGNLVQRNSSAGFVSYHYDYADRLVRVERADGPVITPVASFTYDVFGRRTSKTTDAAPPALPVTRQFIYDPDSDGDTIIEILQDGASIAAFILPEVDDEVLVAFTATGAEGYFHHDDLGNVIALTDAGGKVLEYYEYDDYGQPTFLDAKGAPLVGSDGSPVTASPLGNPFLFHGMFWDPETELYVAGKRDGTPVIEWTFEKAWPCRYEGPELGQYLSRGPSPSDECMDDGTPVRAVMNTRFTMFTHSGMPVRAVMNTRAFAGNNPWTLKEGKKGLNAVNVKLACRTTVTGEIDLPAGRAKVITDRDTGRSKGFSRLACPKGRYCPGGGRAWPNQGYFSDRLDRGQTGDNAGALRMKKGTVKFFNETKGFGLTRLLESIQDESKGFSSLIR